ncbi:MAG TPA: RNA polymerase sigma factor [Methylocella sp.]|nr:RNA polymerase sigma factor [Methylocella sp.]
MSNKKPALSGIASQNHGLLRLLARRVGPQDAADLLQEAYLRMFHHSKSEAIADPEAFLRTTAVNLAKDHLRRRATERKYLDFERDADSVPAQALLADARMEADARLKLLFQAIEQLPPRCRQVFVMRRFDDLHQAEIARRLGISRNMVEKHMRLALERLQAALD